MTRPEGLKENKGSDFASGSRSPKSHPRLYIHRIFRPAPRFFLLEICITMSKRIMESWNNIEKFYVIISKNVLQTIKINPFHR